MTGNYLLELLLATVCFICLCFTTILINWVSKKVRQKVRLPGLGSFFSLVEWFIVWVGFLGFASVLVRWLSELLRAIPRS